MPVPLLIMGKDATDNIPHITDLEELQQSERVNMEFLGADRLWRRVCFAVRPRRYRPADGSCARGYPVS